MEKQQRHKNEKIINWNWDTNWNSSIT